MGELDEMFQLYCTKYYAGRTLIGMKDMIKHHFPKVRKRCVSKEEANTFSSMEGNWVIDEGDTFNVYAGSEGHSTVFKYGKEMVEHMKNNNNSTAGYDGPVYTDWFYMDLDKRNDREGCVIAASPLLDYLRDNKIFHLLFSSGSKGLHLYIPIGYLEYPEEYRNKMHLVCRSFADQLVAQFPTLKPVLDPAVYSKTHLLRMPYTLNYNTSPPKLKIMLSWIGVDEEIPYNKWFKVLPSNKANMTFIRETLLSEHLVNEYKWKVDMTIKIPIVKRSKDAEKFKFPYNEKVCIYKMMNDQEVGERHNTALRIMMHWAEKGLQEDLVYRILMKWREQLIDLKGFPEQDIANMMKSFGKYQYNCQDNIKKKYCTFDNTCVYWKLTQFEESGNNAKSALISYMKEKGSSTESFIYMERIFDKLRFTLKPSRGHILTIVGASGAGKTILAMNIMLRANHINWLFFSYEMGTNEIVSRFATMLSLNLDNQADREKYYHLTKHIHINDTGPPLQHQMKTKRATEAREKVKIHACVSDYLQIIPVLDRNNENRFVMNALSAASEIATTAKNDAKTEEILHIFLGQPTKGVSRGGTTELTEEDVRDGQAYQSMADGILALWRPHRNKKARMNAVNKTASGMMPDNVTTLSLCKWRHGQGDLAFDYNFIPNKLTVQGLFTGTVYQPAREDK